MSSLSSSALADTDIVYVDEALSTGNDDGTSWDDAFRGSTALQEALDEADTLLGGGSPPDLVELWVEEGTYKPSKKTGGTDRTKTFLMADKVHLYGGFARCQASSTNCDNKNDRNYACVGGSNSGRPCEADAECPSSTCRASDTVLSGNIGFPGTFDNAYHVVTHAVDSATTSVVIDGFIIKLGNANGSSPDNQGAGLQIRDSDQCLPGGPTVKNCLFIDNAASDHAAAVNDHGDTTSYDNCVFRDNTAAKGAGLLVDNGSGISVTNCLFVGNNANSGAKEGGGMWAGCQTGETGCPSTCEVTVTDSVFDDNEADFGGALWATDVEVTITDSTFTDNEAQTTCATRGTIAEGGAIWFDQSAAGTSITGTYFAGNTSDRGGAIAIQGTCTGETTCDTVTIDDCEFDGNQTDCPGCSLFQCLNELAGGGAIWLENSEALIKNSLFYGNANIPSGVGIFAAYGGAIFTFDSKTTIENSEFYGNSSKWAGGAIWTETVDEDLVGDRPDLYVNSIFSENHVNSGGTGFFSSAIHMEATQATLRNCTIANNDAGSNATGAIHIREFGDLIGELTAYNCIFWNNDGIGSDQDDQITVNADATADVHDVIWEGHTTCCTGDDSEACICDNIMTVTPFFQSGTSDCDSDGWGDPPCTGVNGDCPSGSPDNCDDYGNQRLRIVGIIVSPAIDAGDNDGISGYSTDLDGKDRLIDRDQAACPTVDLGCYERGSSGCCDGSGTCSEDDGSTCCDQVCCDSTCADGDCCDDGDCSGGDTCVNNNCE